ncbi:MAG: hypothetical protein IJA35_05010 [Clostridia bacterium]|nr:hypothetical protein [Clostridia bacterium]
MKMNKLAKIIMVLMAALMIFAVSCDTEEDVVLDGLADTPEEAMLGFIEAFKMCDSQNLPVYSIERDLVEGLVDTIPEDEDYRRMLRAQFAAFSYEMSDPVIDGDIATATLTITTWSIKAAAHEYITRVQAQYNGVQPKGEEYVKLWESIYADGQIDTVTATDEVKFEKVDGAWKVIVDIDFSRLISGGDENTTTDEE